MKADSGSWLYILLSIVFLVLSAIGNKNKKKATTSTQPVNDYDDYETSPSPQERKWPKSLEDVLNDVLEIPKQAEVVTEKQQPWSREVVLENVQNSYEKIEEEAKSLETIEVEAFTYESLSEDNRIKVPETVIPAHETKEEKEPVLALDNLDLRQGIIYAEILNRKYF